MANQAEVDAGLAVLNKALDQLVSPMYRGTVDGMLTEDVKFNLILDVLDAAKATHKPKDTS